jgi:uncharacterized protein (DUF1697 family)
LSPATAKSVLHGRLNNTAIEKLLATRATTRNWNTVRALCEMSGE